MIKNVTVEARHQRSSLSVIAATPGCGITVVRFPICINKGARPRRSKEVVLPCKARNFVLSQIVGDCECIGKIADEGVVTKTYVVSQRSYS